jgi:demethylmenaquinone methyltransferase/2-methoxy-6-polyprenyl-1,4-benzoquinol methylase
MYDINKIDKPVSTLPHPSTPPGRFALKIGDHLDAADTKKYYNAQLFAEVAPRYDFITRALSLWQDASWKRDLIAALPPLEKPFCLDLACGTGDITLLLAEKYPQGHIVGIDITEPMLALARARGAQPNVQFLNQDMGRLSFNPKSVDIVTGGYALRNAPDLGTTLDEIHRVLKPGGIAAFLDFSKPTGRFPQHLEYWILKIWTGFWGIVLHRNHEVYGYIAESLRRFPDSGDLERMLQDKGFTLIVSRLYLFGITRLLVIGKTELPGRSLASR